VWEKRRYGGLVSKILGFLLGIVAALAGPAAFGVLTAEGGVELNAKEMALAYGIGALIFWALVSYFSGAAALGAALTFGAMIYAVHWIPNRTTNFLNDVPGVTTGMINGIKAYTLNGVVPILAVISLVYAIQLIVQSVRRRRRERAEAERRQREQELAQAQQEAEVAAVYPSAGAEYAPPTGENRFQSFGNTSYDDLFEDEPAPVQPRSQADEHTMQFSEADARVQSEQTATVGAVSNDADRTARAEAADDKTPKPDADATQVVAADSDATQQMPVDRDATQQVPVTEAQQEKNDKDDEPPAASTGATALSAAPTTAQLPNTPPPPPQPPAEQPKDEAPKPETPKPDAPTAEASNAAPEVVEPKAAEATQSQAPETVEPKAPDTAQPPAPDVPKAAAPEVTPPKASETPKTPDQQAFTRPKEEVGQQYRERMDDPEETGEFFVGQFRPAGA
jgi:heme exporter protein D